MYTFLKLMSRWACTLSPADAERWGDRLGRLLWWLVPRKRKQLAIDNILYADITADPGEAARIARQSAERFGPMAMDVLRFPLLRDGKILDIVEFENTQHLDQLAAAGKGCIIATSHCSNWEILGGAFGSRYPNKIVAVGHQQSNAGFDRFIREYRTMLGQTAVYPRNMRDLIRLLKQGKFIGLLFDQDVKDGGILAPLFNTVAITHTGPAVFSYVMKVPIMPLQIYPAGHKWHAVLGEPLYAPRNLPKKEAIAQTTARLNQILVQHVKNRPEDWFWLHNRWKWTRRHYGDPKTITVATPYHKH